MTADHDSFDFDPDADIDFGPEGDDGFDGESVTAPEEGERIAKALARAGVCSRRDAEKLIAGRRVQVNGKLVETPATLVSAHDVLAVDGKPVAKPQTTRVWRYHKPPGLVTTHHDPQGRPTVFDAMPSTMPRVISVGRLDLNSEGLLLLTNDGALARQFEHPSNGWTRRYRVRVFGAVDPARLALLAKGVTVEGVTYGAIQAEVERQSGANSWLTVTLTEGKNREIRRVMDYLGYRVNRLVRVSYGPFYIGRLERGELEEIPPKMLAELLDNVAKAGSADDVKPVRLDRTGWARPKPKPVRPGSRRPDFAAKADERRLEDGPRRPRTDRPRPEGAGRTGAARDGFRRDAKGDDARSNEERGHQGRPRSDRFKNDHAEKSQADRPYAGRPPAGSPAQGRGRPVTSGGRDRSEGDAGREGRKGGDHQRGDRPYSGRPSSDRPREDRPREDRSREDRSRAGRPHDDRPRGGRPQGGPKGGGPKGGGQSGAGGRPAPARTGGGRSEGGRPTGDRPAGGRSNSDRFGGGRPSGGRPGGGRPRTGR